ncbi:MAG: hypothetical protein WBC44_19770 [Planctomycetaceae bacterium]
MISVHFLSLGLVVVWTIACLITRPGRPRRTLGTILLAVLPFWLIGITGSLLLSVNGVPTVEWILPAIAVLLIGIACKSQALFTFSRWLLPVVTVLLCVNFLALTSRGYTAAPKKTVGAYAAVMRARVQNEMKTFREQYPPDATLPPGPIRKVIVHSAESEWHTPLTRLHRLERTPSVVWYPGGKVDEAAEKLEIKPVEAR